MFSLHGTGTLLNRSIKLARGLFRDQSDRRFPLALLIASFAQAESIGAVFCIPLENHNWTQPAHVSASDLLQSRRAFQQPGDARLNPWWEMFGSISHLLPGPDRTHAGQTQAPPNSDLVEQAFNLFLLMDAEQRARLIARPRPHSERAPTKPASP
jgi:hypothetical protein